MGIDKKLCERHAIYNPFMPALNRYSPDAITVLSTTLNESELFADNPSDAVYRYVAAYTFLRHRTLKKAL